MSEDGLPSAIGRYRPVGIVGSGAIGTVYRAHDPLIDRFVAIKVIRGEVLNAEVRDEYLKRFRIEAQAAGRCAHANIVAIFDFADEESHPFIVMELVQGRPFSQILRDSALRAETDCLGVIRQTLQALAYAHEQRITHRDIKPANVIVTSEGQAKVTDFGIARVEQGSQTQLGEMLGTPNYMAPEQVNGGAVDHRADLFASACILYQILNGRAPFAGRNMTETIAKLLDQAPLDLSDMENGPNAAYVPVIRRGLAKKAADRFPNAESFLEALDAVGDVKPTQPEDHTLVLNSVSSFASQESRFAPDELRALETDLARYTGPIARLKVKQAAQVATSLSELHALLSTALSRPEEVTAFLKAHPADPASLHGGTAHAGGTAGTGAASLHEDGHGHHTHSGAGSLTGISRSLSVIPVTPQLQEAAVESLVRLVGPIAKLLVSQASKDAPDARTFVDRLTAQIKRPEDAAEFKRRLTAKISAL